MDSGKILPVLDNGMLHYHVLETHIYLVVNEAGRQKQKYVPNARVQDAARGRAQYRRLLDIADRITQLNLALMKEQDAEP